MRNHLEIIEAVEHYLSTNNQHVELSALQKEVRGGATGGEICANVGSWLLTYKKDKKSVSPPMNELIKEFISYFNYNGLFFNKQ